MHPGQPSRRVEYPLHDLPRPIALLPHHIRPFVRSCLAARGRILFGGDGNGELHRPVTLDRRIVNGKRILPCVLKAVLEIRKILCWILLERIGRLIVMPVDIVIILRNRLRCRHSTATIATSASDNSVVLEREQYYCAKYEQ